MSLKKTLLTSVALVALSGPVVAGTVIDPNITQITVNTQVQQRVQTFNFFEFPGDGLFRVPGDYERMDFDESGNSVPTGEYPVFDEHVQKLRDADVWDQSQIPTGAPYSGPEETRSTGILTGTWTFDAARLRNFDTSLTGTVDPIDEFDLFSDPERVGLPVPGVNIPNSADWPEPLALYERLNGFQVLTPTDGGGEPVADPLVSNFRVVEDVVSGGRVLGSGVTTSTNLYALNDLELGFPTSVDVVVVQATGSPDARQDEVDKGVFLYLLGPDNWFETANANGAELDLNEVLIHGAETVTYDVGRDGLPRYRSFVDNGAVSTEDSPLLVAQFGLADGTTEDSPLLPTAVSVGPAEPGATPVPTFAFDVSNATPQGFVFIDPEIAVGYTYEMVGDGFITGFMAPTRAAVDYPTGDPNFPGYEVKLPDGTTFIVQPGASVTIPAAEEVRSLTLTGIWENLMLDPNDTTTFVAGFQFIGTTSGSSITQTAIVVNTTATVVPLPPAVALMLAGLGGLGVMSRRRRRATV